MARKVKKSQARNRVEKRVLYLYVEGQTEEIYFKHLKDIGVINKDIALKIKINSSEDYFLSSLNEESRILLMDLDGISKMYDPNKRIEKIKNVLNKVPNLVFFNNHSFEIFLLNHKNKYNKKILISGGYTADIASLFGVKDYAKQKRQVERICSKIDVADVARALENVGKLSNDAFCNPSSNFQEILDKINSVPFDN